MSPLIRHPRKWVSAYLRDIRNTDFVSNYHASVVSYPKAGRTWLQFILSSIIADHYGLDKQRTVKYDALVEGIPGAPKLMWTHDDGDFIRESGVRTDPRTLFIYGGRRQYRNTKVILIVRDPRDTAVSYYHQATKRSDNPMSFRSMSEYIRDPLYGICRVVRFYSIWAANTNVPRAFHLVRYEDLLSNFSESIEAILRFIDLSVSPDIIQRAYEESKPDNLRQMEASGQVDGMRVFNANDTNALKVRKAKSGTYLEELSPEDIEYCKHWMLQMPSIYGYRAE